MTVGSPPSTNPANHDTLVGTYRTAFVKLMQGVYQCLPAKVISFNRTKNRVTVQPLLVVLDTQGNQTQRAPIASIPVYNPGGGGFIFSFNLNPGDLGWIKVCDRDMSLFLQGYKQSQPNTYRVKDLADSIFYPDVMTGYTIAEEDATSAVVQSLDGSVKIALSSSKITIQAPTVDINSDSSDITISGDNVEITASAAISLAASEVSISASTSVEVDAPTTELGTGGLPILRGTELVTIVIPSGAAMGTYPGCTITGTGLNKSI